LNTCSPTIRNSNGFSNGLFTGSIGQALPTFSATGKCLQNEREEENFGRAFVGQQRFSLDREMAGEDSPMATQINGRGWLFNLK